MAVRNNYRKNRAESGDASTSDGSRRIQSLRRFELIDQETLTRGRDGIRVIRPTMIANQELTLE